MHTYIHTYIHTFFIYLLTYTHTRIELRALQVKLQKKEMELDKIRSYEAEVYNQQQQTQQKATKLRADLKYIDQVKTKDPSATSAASSSSPVQNVKSSTSSRANSPPVSVPTVMVMHSDNEEVLGGSEALYIHTYTHRHMFTHTYI